MSNQKQYEMTREMAMFVLVSTFNIGGRVDQAQALKNAEYQLSSMESHNNNCWPPAPEDERDEKLQNFSNNNDQNDHHRSKRNRNGRNHRRHQFAD
jgi:hypothetical protein